MSHPHLKLDSEVLKRGVVIVLGIPWVGIETLQGWRSINVYRIDLLTHERLVHVTL